MLLHLCTEKYFLRYITNKSEKHVIIYLDPLLFRIRQNNIL